MNIGEHKTLESAVSTMQMLRGCKPFQYSGKWHVAVTLDGQGVAYRNRHDLSRRMAKDIQATAQGCGSYRVATVG